MPSDGLADEPFVHEFVTQGGHACPGCPCSICDRRRDDPIHYQEEK